MPSSRARGRPRPAGVRPSGAAGAARPPGAVAAPRVLGQWASVRQLLKLRGAIAPARPSISERTDSSELPRHGRPDRALRSDEEPATTREAQRRRAQPPGAPSRRMRPTPCDVGRACCRHLVSFPMVGGWSGPGLISESLASGHRRHRRVQPQSASQFRASENQAPRALELTRTANLAQPDRFGYGTPSMACYCANFPRSLYRLAQSCHTHTWIAPKKAVLRPSSRQCFTSQQTNG
jgi:hypothetical protein